MLCYWIPAPEVPGVPAKVRLESSLKNFERHFFYRPSGEGAVEQLNISVMSNFIRQNPQYTMAAIERGVYIIGMKDQFNIHDLKQNLMEDHVQYVTPLLNPTLLPVYKQTPCLLCSSKHHEMFTKKSGRCDPACSPCLWRCRHHACSAL